MNRYITDVKTVLSLDIRSLALFRMLLGLAVVLDTINRFLFVPAFYSGKGIVPIDLVGLGSFTHAYHFQLMLISDSEWFAYLFLGILLICGILLFIGYQTRLMNFACWLLFSCVIIRDPLTTHAGDTLLIVLLFWAMFLPLNHSFSIDNLINKKTYSSNKSLFFSAASVALYIQVSLVYIMTGIFKSGSEEWITGKYLYNMLSRFDYVEPFAFLVYPYYELLSFLTYFTLCLELFGPLLLFIPFFFVFFRMTAIVLFFGLQLFIGLMVDVGIFPLISTAAILVFIPQQFWERGQKFITIKWNMFSGRYLRIFDVKKVNWLQKPEGIITREPFQAQNKISNVLVSILIAYIVILNLSQVTYWFVNINPPKQPVYFLNLDQRWNMFATPAHDAEYLSVEVTFKDGSQKDLIEHLKINHNSSPDFHHIGYTNYRWRIFFSNNLRHKDWEYFQKSFLNYVVNNSGILNPDESLKKAELAAYRHEIGDYYDHTEIERRVISTIYF